MIECEEAMVLLGPFEDGELAPPEMQEVARHLAGCPACEGALTDYRSVGSLLREHVAEPTLDGFAEAVNARIRRIRTPLHIRVADYFNRFGERLGPAVAMGMAAAVAAVITVVLVTPYARNLAGQNAPATPAVVAHVGELATPAMTLAHNDNRAGEAGNKGLSSPHNDMRVAQDDNASDSEAIISRLVSDSPSVAVWSEPRTDTTVIWVPEQQP